MVFFILSMFYIFASIQNVLPRNLFVLCLLVFLVLIFLSRFIFLGHAIYGDGIYYWAYTRSIVIDNDLDLTDESLHAYSPEGNNKPAPPAKTPGRQLTEDKYYPIGASVLWIPAFIAAHITAEPLGFLENGYSDVYQIAVGVLNISFVSVSALFIWMTIRRQYSRFVSLASLGTLLFATNLLYYAGIDVLNTHPGAILFTSLAVYALFSRRELTAKNFFIFGLITGLCALIRPQDLLFGILFLPEIFRTRSLRHGFIFFTGAVLAFLPQILTSLAIFGDLFRLPYITGNNTFNVLNPHLFELIFDRTRGLLYFSPIYLLAFTGLFLYFKSKKVYSGRILSLVILEVFVISIWSGWAQGESYGMRMFISLIPVFAIGLCELIAYSRKYLSKAAVLAILALFVIQNSLMIASFHIFLHEPTYVESELSKGGKIKQEILLELGSRFN